MNFEDRGIEIIQFEQSRENRDWRKKWTHSQGTVWQYDKDLIFMSSESQKEKKKSGPEKIFEGIMVENSPN